MSKEHTAAAELPENETTKKALKAEIKAAEKAKKAAKADKKTLRKIEKQQRKDAVPEIKSEIAAKKAKAATANTQSGVSTSMSLGAKIQAVARMARGNLASDLLKHGLYAGQEQVLFLLDEHGPLALTELAEKLDVRAPTITKTVTRMEAQGFLSRAVSRDDARSIIIALTPDGRRVMKIGREIVHSVESKTFSVLSASDCASLQKYLDLVFLQRRPQ